MTMTRQSRLVTHGIRNLDERDESNVLRVLRSQSQRVNVLVESKNERGEAEMEVSTAADGRSSS